ncbi:MAG: acylphosphatase [Thermoguttaceae bacterium]
MDASDKHSLENREIYYRGRVQGIGFRFTVRMIAARFAVSGFVKNLPDGRVQLVVEGETGELQQFLDAISAEMGRYISDSKQQITPASGRFDAFEIRF